MNDPAFTTRQVIAITGISQRRLAYWRKTGLIVPTGLSAGGHARYSFTDLVILRTIKQLIDAGVSVQRIRHSIQSLRDHLPKLPFPLHEMTLVATGDVILVMHQGSAFETLSGQQWIFPVAQLVRDSERITHSNEQQELFPDSAPEISMMEQQAALSKR